MINIFQLVRCRTRAEIGESAIDPSYADVTFENPPNSAAVKVAVFRRGC
jgi:hypothetical protein